jgi:Zn-finger nucleic acid-binding protein
LSEQLEGLLMLCPKCNEQMEIQVIEGADIDVCTKCKGVWFDQDEMRQAKDQLEPDLNWMDFEIWKHTDKFKMSSTPVICPKCNDGMVTLDYDQTGVMVDYCPQCRGVWLDGGEFKKIIGVLETEMANKPISEYIKESLQEAKEIVTGPESLASEWKDFMTVLRMFQYRILVQNPKLHDKIINYYKMNPMK